MIRSIDRAKFPCILQILLFAIMAGCGYTRVANVAPKPSSEQVVRFYPPDYPVEILNDTMQILKRYFFIGKLSADTRLSSGRWTQQDAREAALEEARGQGANAILNLRYAKRDVPHSHDPREGNIFPFGDLIVYADHIIPCRKDEMVFPLPDVAPYSIVVRDLDGTKIKQHYHELMHEYRIWKKDYQPGIYGVSVFGFQTRWIEIMK